MSCSKKSWNNEGASRRAQFGPKTRRVTGIIWFHSEPGEAHISEGLWIRYLPFYRLLAPALTVAADLIQDLFSVFKNGDRPRHDLFRAPNVLFRRADRIGSIFAYNGASFFHDTGEVYILRIDFPDSHDAHFY